MRLTVQELEKMRSVDIGAVDAEELADVSGMAFDSRLSLDERVAHFLARAINPYCFCVGGGILDVPPGQRYNIGVM